jgi:hypothetical protein
MCIQSSGDDVTSPFGATRAICPDDMSVSVIVSSMHTVCFVYLLIPFLTLRAKKRLCVHKLRKAGAEWSFELSQSVVDDQFADNVHRNQACEYSPPTVYEHVKNAHCCDVTWEISCIRKSSEIAQS